MVDCSVELIRVGDFYPLVCCDDDDRRRMADAEALTECTVCFDLRSATTGWVDHEGHGLAVSLKPSASKFLQVVLTCDHSLVGEYVSPEVLSHLWGYFVLKVTGVDGTGTGPSVTLDDEVVVDPWNVVAIHRIPHERRDMGAERAFEILELDDGDLCAGRRFEDRGVSEWGSARRWEGYLGGEGKSWEQSDGDRYEERFHTVHSNQSLKRRGMKRANITAATLYR